MQVKNTLSIIFQDGEFNFDEISDFCNLQVIFRI